MEFLLSQTFLALILIGFSYCLLGVFVLFKGLAFFGDAASHSLLLALAVGFGLGLPQNFALFTFAVIFALFVFAISKNRYFSKDTLIAIASYFCISSAILINDLSPDKIDFEAYIFGDISMIQGDDLYILAALAFVVATFVALNFNKLLFANLNQDLAKINGVKVDFLNAAFMVLLSITIALCIKIVGVFLMTALLVLPAAIARLVSKSAKQMAVVALIVTLPACGVSAFLAVNYYFSLGAITIFIFCVIFIILNLFRKC